MARAFPVSQPQDYAHEPNPGDWQALRGELVALLDQVEGQYVRAGTPEPGYEGLAQRMRDLRYQVGDSGPVDRHREALRSVKRAVERFREDDEGLPAHSDDILQSAIQEIRGRQLGMPLSALQNAAPQPRFGDMAQAMSGLSGRLEQIEGELRSQRGNSTHIKEIADQVSQLSHVVELLAGAVGETGQVKRLEGQIAGLAKLIGDAPKVDLTLLNQRLDEVAATVERLADLQVQQIQHVVREAEAAPQKDLQVSEAMRAVEAGVRHVYDRIDTMERTLSMPPAEIEQLSTAMAQFTSEMRAGNGRPDSLLGLVDALNSRVSEIEGRGDGLGELRADLDELRRAVLGAFEPRFAALESQIGALGDKLSGQREVPGVAQIEAQIRQLMARMDQTGEQLTGLARLYSSTDDRAAAPDFEALANLAATRSFETMARSDRPAAPAPDFEALADLVAARTSEAFAKKSKPAATALSEEGFSEIERRVSRLLQANAGDKAPPAPDLSGMESGIRAVNERLARLEASLAPAAVAKAAAPQAAMPAVAAEPAPQPKAKAPVPKKDAMPRNPGEDAPLTEFTFPDLGPVRAALEAKNGPRKLHPGMAKDEQEVAPPAAMPLTPEMAGGTVPPRAAKPAESAPRFDPAAVVRPPRPESSLGSGEPNFGFASTPAASEPVASPELPASPATRNTFIEAARRAAQRQTPPKPELSANSLIGRALARFQPSGDEAAATRTEPLPEAVEAKPVAPPAKPAKLKQKKSAAAEKPEPSRPVEPVSSLFDDAAKASEEPATESFLSRHRKPILLIASAVAVSFMTLNLVMQRMNSNETHAAVHTIAPATSTPQAAGPYDVPAAPAVEPQADATPPAATVPEADTAATAPAGDAAKPAADAPATPSADGPRVIPMADTLTTGSIDPAAAQNFSTPNTPLPATLQTALVAPDAIAPAGVDAAAPAKVDSPVKVELPPDTLGPLDLRQAAADGDARAQFEIAAIYSEGRAVPADFGAAEVWYERAAAQGFAPAQYRLGNLYENGKGVKKDLEQARLWYQRAAEAGNRMSMHNLAALYAGGQMGKQDFASAAEWFEQAATRGMTDSQFNLGMLYARGLGVPQNLETSFKWFSLAASHGDSGAAKARDDMAKSLDAEAVKRVNAEIAGWKPTAIDLAANFAPIGTWSKDFNPGQAITTKDVVSKVQTALARLGFDVGAPDGHAGPKTAEAIKAFEKATGMSEVGAINPRLLAVLGSQPV